MSSTEPQETSSLCSNCRFPINQSCKCEDCSANYRNDKNFCHVCLEMHRSVIRQPGLSRAQNEWTADQNERRRRMGLN